MSELYELAAGYWQNENDTKAVPAIDEIRGTQALAALAKASCFDEVGITTDYPLATYEDLNIMISAAAAMTSIGGWIRCDIVGEVCRRYNTQGVRELRSKHPKAYTSLLEASRSSLSTMQNDYTTYVNWPRAMREPLVSYSHHRVLNGLNEAERLRWIGRAAEGGLSVPALAYEVGMYSQVESIEDAERWERINRRIRHFENIFDVTISAGDSQFKLIKDGEELTLVAGTSPNGKAIIKIQGIQ